MHSAAFWMQRYFSCTHVRLKGLTVYNHSNKNNDGIDIDSSNDVIVSDCLVDTSDDAIVIKANGEKPSENIVITNCIVATHASAIKTGTGSVGGFNNITISNIVIRPSKSPIMKHPLGAWNGLSGIDLITTDGGAMRNISISHVIMDGVQNPIHLRLGNRLSGNVALQGYGEVADQEQGVKISEKAAQSANEIVMESIQISNIIAHNVGPWPVVIAGHPGHPVKNVTLRDIQITSAHPGTQADIDTPPDWNPGKYPFRGMYGTRMPAYGIVTYHTEGLRIENFQVTPAKGEPRPKAFHFFRN